MPNQIRLSGCRPIAPLTLRWERLERLIRPLVVAPESVNTVLNAYARKREGTLPEFRIIAEFTHQHLDVTESSADENSASVMASVKTGGAGSVF